MSKTPRPGRGVWRLLMLSYLAFRTRHQPYMVRLSYRYELRSALTFPLAAAMAEGTFTGIVASKYFHASPVLIAVITAAPMFGNILALVWAELGKTRRKVPFINWLQLGVITCIAGVALTCWLPLGVGGWVFAALIILARVLASGIITLRSAIWRHNYPRHLRGQIVARITVVATAVLATTTLAGSIVLDRRADAFVWFYPSAALLGAVGIWQFSNIRVRGETSQLRRVNGRRRMSTISTPRPESLALTDETNVINYEPRPQRGLPSLVSDAMSVLRTDRRFREYQWWQSISGSSFMMMQPPLVFMVSQQMTDARTQYALATVVLQIIPLITSLVFTQAWAPVFDRLHILRFRAVQSFVSLGTMSLIFVGAYFDSLLLIAVAQFCLGVANAAGNLAWNLGQNDFAPPEKIATYMGVHVMLTGVRGCFAPFLGVLLYQQLIGRWVFAVAAGLSLLSLVGFQKMARGVPTKHPARTLQRAGTVEPATSRH